VDLIDRTLSTGIRVRVRHTPDLTVIGKLYGTILRSEPGRPGYFQVKLDGQIGNVNGKRVRLPGRTITAHGSELERILR
jgi:hypothetical protein